jgi:hypothetical protein
LTVADRHETWRVSRVVGRDGHRPTRPTRRGRLLAGLAIVIAAVEWVILDSMKMGLPAGPGGTFRDWTIEMRLTSSALYLAAMAATLVAIARSGGRRGLLAMIITNALFAFSVLW